MSDEIRRRSAFSIVPEWVIRADISSHAVRLYAALDRYAGLPKGAIPSRKTLADEWLRCSLPTVDRAKRELMEIGALTVEKVGRNRNLYHLEDQPNRITGDLVNRITGDSTRKRDIERDSPLSGGAQLEPGAQQLVAEYCDAVEALGSPAPRRLVGMVAKQVGELIDEGVDPEVVSRALELLLEKRLHPSTLATLVPEAMAGPRQAQRFGRGMTVQQMLDRSRQLGGVT